MTRKPLPRWPRPLLKYGIVLARMSMSDFDPSKPVLAARFTESVNRALDAAAEARGRAECEQGHAVPGEFDEAVGYASACTRYPDPPGGFTAEHGDRAVEGQSLLRTAHVGGFLDALARCAATHAAIRAEGERAGEERAEEAARKAYCELDDYGDTGERRLLFALRLKQLLTGDGETPKEGA